MCMMLKTGVLNQSVQSKQCDDMIKGIKSSGMLKQSIKSIHPRIGSLNRVMQVCLFGFNVPLKSEVISSVAVVLLTRLRKK